MSILCEVRFEPLQCDGSNYYSWSAHVLNALRALGPSYEQVVEMSILPKDFDNLSKLSNEDKSVGFATFVTLTSCLRIWIKNFHILYRKRTSCKRHVLMLIVFGSFLK